MQDSASLQCRAGAHVHIDPNLALRVELAGAAQAAPAVAQPPRQPQQQVAAWPGEAAGWRNVWCVRWTTATSGSRVRCKLDNRVWRHLWDSNESAQCYCGCASNVSHPARLSCRCDGPANLAGAGQPCLAACWWPGPCCGQVSIQCRRCGPVSVCAVCAAWRAPRQQGTAGAAAPAL